MNILNQSIQESRTNNSKISTPTNNQRSFDYSLSIYDALHDLFERAIVKAYGNDISNIQTVITPSKIADYQCNSVMSILQAMKAKNIKANPQEIAKNICLNLEENSLIEKVEVAGPGFINIFLAKKFAHIKSQESYSKWL